MHSTDLQWLQSSQQVLLQVALHGGAPNKNIGDAFLLVWKFPKGCTMEDIARVTSIPDSSNAEVGLQLNQLIMYKLCMGLLSYA